MGMEWKMTYFKPLSIKNYRTHCKKCNKPIRISNKSGYCSNCGNRIREKNRDRGLPCTILN